MGKRAKFLKAGVWTLIIGTGPLLVVGTVGELLGNDPNPIGLGLLMVVTLPVALVLIAIGLLTAKDKV